MDGPQKCYVSKRSYVQKATYACVELVSHDCTQQMASSNFKEKKFILVQFQEIQSIPVWLHCLEPLMKQNIMVESVH